MSKKRAIIIGAGPAGLTAAYELLHKTAILPVVFESAVQPGGLSKTVNYKGNRIDIGGHRFFSKSDRIMRWWLNILPLQGAPSKDDIKLKREIPLSKEIDAPDPQKEDRVMLWRQRISRIFAFRKFFDYPISLSLQTLANLGIVRVARIMFSYLRARLFPIRHEKNLEDFFINRFGRELYSTFFKSYTEKVWGVSCTEISPEWGAQRIKGLSISKAIWHIIKKLLSIKTSSQQVETSLIEQFMYPKFGPGQMWEEVARLSLAKGAVITFNQEVVGMAYEGKRVVSITVKDKSTLKETVIEGDYFFSTMPIKELVSSMTPPVPEKIGQIAKGLMYRDFITVGLLLTKMTIKNQTKIKTINDIVPDNWIYVQEENVKIGRVQIFNNWSPYMVHDDNHIWIGLEYFCNRGDELWEKSDTSFIAFAIEELCRIGFVASKDDVLDSVMLRVPQAYPSYYGTYDQFDTLRAHLDSFENLFLVGRNGMHRYNNSDHSMMTAMVAVENIINNKPSKDNIWAVNMEKEYHEEKKS
jgi:protoporphyrinogen oxidase